MVEVTVKRGEGDVVTYRHEGDDLNMQVDNGAVIVMRQGEGIVGIYPVAALVRAAMSLKQPVLT